MKKLLLLCTFFFSQFFFSQTDFSDSWEDFYSYNNVKDFVKVDDVIYALVDNAVFTYDAVTGELEKLSSVKGLSGEATSSIHYNTTFKRLFIGYENGLLEIVDDNGAISVSSGIVNFNQSGNKTINHIAEFNNQLYLSTPFGIVTYDADRLEFGDTFFIGNGSSALEVHQTTVFKGLIYAATEDGIFTADVTSNLLIDFNNWQQQSPGNNYTQIAVFNEQVFAVQNSNLLRFANGALNFIRNFSQNIIAIKPSSTHLSVVLNKTLLVLNRQLNEISKINTNTDFDFTLNNAFVEGDEIFIGTKEFGILNTNLAQSIDFKEIHPEGPLSNDAFYITAQNNTIWVVFGGYNNAFTPLQNRQGYSYFNGENWINTNFDPNFPVTDLNHVSVDPNNKDRVFLSSFGTTGNLNSVGTGGLLELENNTVKIFYNDANSPLSDAQPIPSVTSIRVGSTVFDNEGNLWVTNIAVEERIKRLSASGEWSSFNLLRTRAVSNGLSGLTIDRNGTKWMGSRGNGVYAFNENGNRQRALVPGVNEGNLPDLNVKTVAIDAADRVWIGSKSGLVVYNNASGIFNDSSPNARPIVINGDENGFGDRLLGDQEINSIVVDGAENKWFGTNNGGVIHTNSTGQTTLANFSTANSPLPSNRIIKISADKSTGKVFFATDKGIVAYDSGVSPFGDVLTDVYAYPNPVLKNHKTVTIDGRNGNHLPQGTNVKILDVSGNLVYETNVVEGQELQGGKVVWNKTNLAGTKVASGVYIVLLSTDDASENAVTKIAIVN